MSDILWCCHIRGPDDVHAAPDYETALKWADMVNAYGDCLPGAVPAIWPWSDEAHAEDLPKSIEYFSQKNTLAEFQQMTADAVEGR